MTDVSAVEADPQAGGAASRPLRAPILEVRGLVKHFPVRAGLLRRAVNQVHAVCGVSFDVGEGKGKERTVTLKGGVVGLIFDCRGRQPFKLPEDRAARIAKLNQWNEALDIYPPRDARKVSTAELRPVEAGA